MTRTGGATPAVQQARGVDVPAVITAKLCIDTAGRVASVQIITKLAAALASDLTATLKGWTYTPYHQHGAAAPACLFIQFRVK